MAWDVLSRDVLSYILGKIILIKFGRDQVHEYSAL